MLSYMPYSIYLKGEQNPAAVAAVFLLITNLLDLASCLILLSFYQP